LMYQNAEFKEVPTRKINREKQGRTEDIILTGRPLFIPTKEESEKWYKQPGRQEFVGTFSASWIGVPMKVGEKILGVVATYHLAKEFAYTQDDLEILQTMATIAAIVLENARLYNYTQRKQTVLIDLAQKLTANIQLKEEDILGLIYQNATELMDTTNMYIAIYDEADDTLSFPLMYKDAEPQEVAMRKINREKRGRTEEIILSMKPIFIQTQEESGKWYQQAGHQEFIGNPLASWIGVPMKLGEKILGVVATFHPTKDFVYSQDDLEILQAMANWAAIALENARLVSDLKQAQNEIAKKERDFIMSSVAMDFIHRANNLHGTIPPWVSLLKQQLSAENKQNPKIMKYLDAIVRDVSVALKEAHDLKKFVAEPERINLVSILNSIVNQVEIMASPDIEIVFTPESATFFVYGIKKLLHTTINNVIQNALKAISANQGKITITLKCTIQGPEQAQQIEIAITDTGCGISEDRWELIFEQGQSYWTDQSGTGYGLWQARNIVQNFGGSIRVAQSSIGAGTTFLITLPASE
jgi:signal transduction histidine kinase